MVNKFFLFFTILLLATLSLIVKVNGNVCTETVNVVPHCPNASENHQRTIRKCSRVCQQYKRKYEYHCMSDSSKTGFFEFCAFPKKLFGNCPVYDTVGQRIQLDPTTRCTLNPSEGYYLSSKVSSCDPGNCLQIQEHAKSVKSSESMPTFVNLPETTTTNTANSNIGSNHPNQTTITIATLVLVLCIFASTIAILIFRIMHPQNGKSYGKKNKSRSYPNEGNADISDLIFKNPIES